jgi:hypothetical protein
MPIDLPGLDDRRFSDLMEEALRMIPAHAPKWTHHNPSDPGITLVELFAFLTEMLIYRLNRVTPESVLAFLKLINGPDWNPGRLEAKAWSDLGLRERDGRIRAWWQELSSDERRRTVAETVRRLRTPVRAVSSADFVALATAIDEQRVARVHCIPGKDSHIRVIVVPRPEKPGDFSLPAGLKKGIQDNLRDCLLTTRVDVEEPKLVGVGATFTLKLEADTPEPAARQAAEDALRKFLDPLIWPFGQAIYLSSLTALFAVLPGIRDVEDIVLTLIPAMEPLKDQKTGAIIAMPIPEDGLAVWRGPMNITMKRIDR